MMEQQNNTMMFDDVPYKLFIQNILDTRGRFACGDEYHERHHIVPKCLGGTNDEENLIDLFAREHFIAHKLLAEENPNNKSLVYAWHMMSTVHSSDYLEISPEEYEKARIAFVESITGENNPFYGKNISDEHKQRISEANKGKIFSLEHCKKLSESHIGMNNPNYGRSPSEETRIKLSNSNKGKIRTEATCKKLSEANKGKHTGKDNHFYGKHHSPEAKAKISEANKGRSSPNKGISPSKETCQKISEHHADVSGKNNPRARKAIRLYDLKIFDTVADAAIEEGTSRRNMCRICKEKRGFMYYDEYLMQSNNPKENLNEQESSI